MRRQQLDGIGEGAQSRDIDADMKTVEAVHA
jgi:hypothetical protein